MLSNKELSSSIQSKHLIKHLLRHIFLIGKALHARIVDHNVQASIVRHGGIEEFGHLARLADIGLDRYRAATLGFNVGHDGEGGFGGTSVVEDDGRAARGELTG